MKTDLRKHDLTEIFIQSAKEYASNFNWLEKLVISSETGLIFVSEEMQDVVKEHPKAFKEYLKNEAALLKDSDVGAAALSSTNDEIEGVSTLFSSVSVNKKSKIKSFHGLDFNNKKSIIFNYDHEFGHLIAETPYKIATDHQIEGIADTFALLLHIKRFGYENYDIFHTLATISTDYIILSDNIDYYTSHAVYAVKALSEEIDIQKLSIKEIAEYATKIGSSFALSEETLEKIKEVYTPAREEFNKETPRKEFLEEVVKVMLSNKDDEDVYRAGKLFLSETRTNIFVNQYKKYDSFWSHSLKEMERHEAETGFSLNPIKVDYPQIIPFIKEIKLPPLRISA